MNLTFRITLILLISTLSINQIFAQVDCGATTATITEPTGQTTLCSDGTDAVTLVQNPADNTSGLPDYSYIIESPAGLFFLEQGDSPLTISPSQFGATAGDNICISGIAYDIGEFNDLISTLSSSFICSLIAGLTSAQCSYISQVNDQGGLTDLEGALEFGQVLGEVTVNTVSESILLLINIDEEASALGGICVAISNGGMGYDYCYVVEDCNVCSIFGCTDATACNYDPMACAENNTCEFAPCSPGCTDACASNYNPNADGDNGSCFPYNDTCNTDCTQGAFGGIWDSTTCACINTTSPISGCTDPNACNYSAVANCDNGSCDFGDVACPNPCSPIPDVVELNNPIIISQETIAKVAVCLNTGFTIANLQVDFLADIEDCQ